MADAGSAPSLVSVESSPLAKPTVGAVPGAGAGEVSAGRPPAVVLAGSTPFLDQGGQNVPRDAGNAPPTEEKKGGWQAWTKKHYRVRSQLRDSISVWQRAGWKLYFLTFTSSAASGQVEADRTALLANWQALRKRLARRLGVDPCDIHYRGVRTSEGFGVLHLLVAVDPGRVGYGWRLVDFENLQDWWRELHGAWHVNVKRIRSDTASARRVSRYVVSQYLVRQGGELVDALVRTFGSRLGLRLPAIRERFRELVRLHGGAERYRWMKAAMDVDAGLDWEKTWREFGRIWWRMRNGAWSELLERGQCEVFGAKLVLVPWWGGRIEEV